MENETLDSLITGKGFDSYVPELTTRCDAEGIDFATQYNPAGDTLTVWLNFGNIPATVEIKTDGTVNFIYFEGGGRRAEKFTNFSAEDFHLLIDHAFLYLRDGNFQEHKEWYAGLEKV